MDDSNDNPLQSEPVRPSRFLGCFGFSSRKLPVVLEKSRSIKKKKKRLISWSARIDGKKSATKTVPVDSSNNTVSDQKVVAVTKSKKKKGGKTIDHKLSSNSKTIHQVPAAKKAAADHQESKQRLQEIISEVSEEKIITETRDSMNDQMNSSKDTNNTLQKQFCRKIDAIRAGHSQPGSPDTKPKSNRPSSVSKSTSMPVPDLQKPMGNNGSTKLMIKKTSKENKEASGNKFDPVIGLSIIMVTLVIMLFWGRLCAILCTSAWFYFIPRFRTGSNQNVNYGSISVEPDFDSEEYKKRVVLEGLLERNHRSIL